MMASKTASGLSGLAEIRELFSSTCWRSERREEREGRWREGLVGRRDKEEGERE